MSNIVKLDKDFISEKEAKKLREKIKKERQCQVILYQTKHGFHFELIFNKEIPIKKNFEIREQYGDCSERLRISKLKSRQYVSSKDILFTIKNDHVRKRIW